MLMKHASQSGVERFIRMLQYTRETAIQKLLESYQAYYNISMFEEECKPLTAICEFFEHSEKFVLSKKAELWSANCEEFIYLYDVPHLTKEIFEDCRKYAYEDGMKRANIGPGHMYTYITPIFICDTCDEDARRALRKCRIYKSFQFSLHGWMDFHVAMLEVKHNQITSNSSGKCVGKILKKVLFQKKRRKFL